MRPPTHTYTYIHNHRSPLAINTRHHFCLPFFSSHFLCSSLSLRGHTLTWVVKARNKICQVSYQYGDPMSLAAILSLEQAQLGLPVIFKPLFGEASLSEQWGNIQCISIERLWFLFVLHLLCPGMVHRTDSSVHFINCQTTWTSKKRLTLKMLNTVYELFLSLSFFCSLALALFLTSICLSKDLFGEFLSKH